MGFPEGVVVGVVSGEECDDGVPSVELGHYSCMSFVESEGLGVRKEQLHV